MALSVAALRIFIEDELSYGTPHSAVAPLLVEHITKGLGLVDGILVRGLLEGPLSPLLALCVQVISEGKNE